MYNENDYKTFEDFQQGFLKMRTSFANKLDRKTYLQKEKIFDIIFTDVLIQAVEGNIIAQDFVSYMYKKGSEFLKENIELSMKWQILAAANGNIMSMRRLAMFLSYGIDEVLMMDNVVMYAEKNDIYKENYVEVLSKLLCEAIVDDMKIDALQLSKEPQISIPYNPVSLRKFDFARNRAIEVVKRYLKGEI